MNDDYYYLFGLRTQDEEKIDRAVKLLKSARRDGLSREAKQNFREKARGLIREAVDWQGRVDFE